MITYLLGAGASAEALPPVVKIPERIEEVISLIKEKKFVIIPENLNYSPELYFPGEKDLIEDLNWLKNKSSLHSSVDTFAKKLFLQDEKEELKRLKIILSVFLTVCELSNPLDKRYDSFIASLCEESLNLPQNIRIVSWNYDIQFERSYSNYAKQNDLLNVLDSLNVHSRGLKTNYNPNQFGIFKLNGSSLIRNLEYPRQIKGFTDSLIDYLDGPSFKSVIYNYQKLKEGMAEPGICFAWEKDNVLNTSAFKDLESTQTLIVIGYSFPFFNRVIDRQLIASMQNLERVYYQTKEDKNEAEERLNIIFENWIGKPKIKVSNNTDQFYLPPQL